MPSMTSYDGGIKEDGQMGWDSDPLNCLNVMKHPTM